MRFSLLDPGAVAGAPRRPWPLLGYFVAAVVLAWSVLPALLQTVPHADNVEQLNWAHHLQWGYLKHPPLPTALLWAAIAIAGPSAYLTYLLAMACVGATLLLLWRVARCVLDVPGALAAVFVTSADYYLMGRGSFLNHNTVMLPFVAAGAWAVLELVRQPAQPRQWRWWLLLGLSQALGLLTKYQMAIVIAANAAALLALYPWREPGRLGPTARGVALCAAATLLPLLPHLQWLQANAFSSFSYAGQNLLADLPPLQRLQHTGGFLAQQLGRLLPAAAALGLAVLLQRRACAAPPPLPPAASIDPQPVPLAPAADPLEARARRALLILAVVPVAIIAALALLAGVAPQNHWGASSTLLLPLLAVVWITPARRPGATAALLAVVAMHIAAIAWNIAAARMAPAFHHTFAVRPLAQMSQAHWDQHVHGPLLVVAGPDWEAGALSLALHSHPAVLASGERRQAPWVTDDLLERCGALLLWRTGQSPAEQIGASLAERMQFPVLLASTVAGAATTSIWAGILMPVRDGCAEAAR